MPELPDLQVFSSNLDRQLAGKKLQQIKVLKRAKLNVPKARIQKALQDQRLQKVYREGKELRLAFQNKNVLGLHMMLRGKLQWLDAQAEPSHVLLELWFEGDKRLVLTDYQYNARITLNPEAADAPDALAKEVNAAFWKKQLQTKATIKNLLLDQQVVRGIGNAYADEILWDAGISPFSVSRAIPTDKVKALARSVKQVLKKAIQQIRKAAPGIIGGELRDFLGVHNAAQKRSPTGAVIKQKTVGGRKTYYTEEQELFK
jgi:formamidopyrimidine-DNA glycosylase